MAPSRGSLVLLRLPTYCIHLLNAILSAKKRLAALRKPRSATDKQAERCIYTWHTSQLVTSP